MTKTIPLATIQDDWDLPYGGNSFIRVVKQEFLDEDDGCTYWRCIFEDKSNNTYWTVLYEKNPYDGSVFTEVLTEDNSAEVEEPSVVIYQVYPKLITVTTYADTPTEDMPEWEQGVYPE